MVITAAVAIFIYVESQPDTYASTDDLIADLEGKGWACRNRQDLPYGAERETQTVFCDLEKDGVTTEKTGLVVYESEAALSRHIRDTETMMQVDYCRTVTIAVIIGPNWLVSFSEVEGTKERLDAVVADLDERMVCPTRSTNA